MYRYKAVVRSVYDADTIRCDIDLGCKVWLHNEPLRLYGIDAPELRGFEREDGLMARDWLRKRLPEGAEIIIDTKKDSKGKYGRWLAVVHLDGENLNEKLVKSGHAIWAKY